MTIPIIPGPFGFLKDLGQSAIDTYEKKKEQQRSEAIQTLGLLFQMLPNRAHGQTGPPGLNFTDSPLGPLPQVVPTGPDRYSYTPQEEQAFRTIFHGIPDLGPSPAQQVAETTAKNAPEKQAADIAGVKAGTATEQARLPSVQAQAQLDQADLGRLANEIKDMTPAQFAQRHKILSPAAAAAAEELYLKKAEADLAALDVTGLQTKIQKTTLTGMLASLAKDGQKVTPEELKVLRWGALPGGVDYLIAQLREKGDMARAYLGTNSDRVRLATTLLGNIRSVFEQQNAAYERDRNIIANDPLTNDRPELRAQRLEAFDKDQKHPPPNYNEVQGRILQAYDMPEAEFNASLRSLAGIVSGNPQASAPAGSFEGDKTLLDQQQAQQIATLKEEAQKYGISADAAIAEVNRRYTERIADLKKTHKVP